MNNEDEELCFWKTAAGWKWESSQGLLKAEMSQEMTVGSHSIEESLHIQQQTNYRQENVANLCPVSLVLAKCIERVVQFLCEKKGMLS